MKKFFNGLTAFVCALSVCTAIPINSYAKNANEKYKDIILSVADSAETPVRYSFFDLDGDGSEELIVSEESTEFTGYSMRVYTMKNSSAEQIKFKGFDTEKTDVCQCTGISVNTESGVVKIDLSGEWDRHIIYCEYADTYNGAVISKIDEIVSRNNSYKHNGEEIKKSEFLSIQKSYGDDTDGDFEPLGTDYGTDDLSPFGEVATTSTTEKIQETTTQKTETTEQTENITTASTETVTTTEKVKQFDSSEIFMSWKEAYSAVLRYFTNTSEYSENISSWDLYDINGDEIPELFISPKSSQDSGVYVYTFDKNKCCKLSFPNEKSTSETAGSWGVVSVIPEKNLLRSYTLKDCVEKNIYYNFSGSTFKSDVVFASNSIEGQYFCNNSEVTPEDYFISLKSYEDMNEYVVGRKYSFKDISVSFEAYVSALEKKNAEPETEPAAQDEEENKISSFKKHLPKFLAAGALIAAGIAILIPFMKNQKAKKKKSSK